MARSINASQRVAVLLTHPHVTAGVYTGASEVSGRIALYIDTAYRPNQVCVLILFKPMGQC